MANYTETLQEYIDNGKNLHRELFDMFPKFTLNSLNLDMYNLFIKKYDVREIGAETEQLFEHYLVETLNEMLIKYVPKISLYLENFSQLMARSIQVDRTKTLTKNENGTNQKSSSQSGSVSSSKDTSNDNKDYLNPISSAENLKLQSSKKNDETVGLEETNSNEEIISGSNSKDITETMTENDYKVFGYFRDNAQVMQVALSIQSCYYDCIAEFEKIFMGVL